ncbi:MAG: UDP-3-O-(3-hydroxymyristoyl)glucosamine N-acyltransferase [Sphingobacteriales bacterium]|nr:UDP-3-O-(3-hydroxymyristoyl)glucosamine N-acyltransferase [Sphingobacteriales bacterium]
MQITLKEICDITDGKLSSSLYESRNISGIATLEEACADDLSFYHNAKYLDKLYQTQAGVVLVPESFRTDDSLNFIPLYVKNVYESLVLLLEKFSFTSDQKTGIEEPVFIGSNATIGKDCYLGAFTYIGSNAKIGEHVKIYPNCYIGENVEIEDYTVVYAGVKIYSKTKIGKKCILHSGCVIGSDGFGHAPMEDGTFRKIPQIGNVVIHDNVEIGANTTIDRATLESTIIRSGVKLDNLIMIAHNVEIGENTVIAAQSGISGSTKLGKNCMIGGQVGIVGHIMIAEKSRIGAKSGVSRAISEADKDWFGIPALPLHDTLRIHAILRKLPDLYRKINLQEKEIQELKKQHNS